MQTLLHLAGGHAAGDAWILESLLEQSHLKVSVLVKHLLRCEVPCEHVRRALQLPMRRPFFLWAQFPVRKVDKEKATFFVNTECSGIAKRALSWNGGLTDKLATFRAMSSREDSMDFILELSCSDDDTIRCCRGCRRCPTAHARTGAPRKAAQPMAALAWTSREKVHALSCILLIVVSELQKALYHM